MVRHFERAGWQVVSQRSSLVHYHFRTHEDSDGLWAECLELPSCFSQAEDSDQLERNAREALNLYLNEPDEAAVVFPLPRDLTGTDVFAVPVEPAIALSVVVRAMRAQHDYSQQQAARMLGLKNLWSYQRLERPCNPSLRTLGKLKKLYPELSVDLVLEE
jgi:antitoxin HicB